MLRHNENITCRVCTSAKDYSLRIHCPVEDFNTSLVTYGYDAYELFQSEVDLLRYMRDHGFCPLLN